MAGGVRLVAYYEAFGRRARMVFHFRTATGHDANLSTLKALTEQYGLWENDGLGVGYSLLRSDDSHFVDVRAWALSGVARPTYQGGPFDLTGQIPGFVSPLLPTGKAPIVRWATLERGLATGRTYCVGVSEGVLFMGPDQERLGPGATDNFAGIFDLLRSLVAPLAGCVMCHRTVSSRGGVGIGPGLIDVTGTGCYELMGSRRLRTRPR